MKHFQELAKKTEGDESDEDEEVEAGGEEQEYDEEEQEEVGIIRVAWGPLLTTLFCLKEKCGNFTMTDSLEIMYGRAMYGSS